MSTQHTPGPWYLEGHSHKLGYAVSAEFRDSEPVAFVKNNHDSRLIAAAPELLTFAQEFLKDYQSEDGMASMKHYARAAQAAIAKATGETK